MPPRVSTGDRDAVLRQILQILPTSAVNVTLLAFAAERNLAGQNSIHIIN